MNKKYILTIDQGTTSTRAIIFDNFSNEIAKSQIEFQQICPFNGWVEHNPEEIYELTIQTIKNVLNLSKIKVEEIKAIGITNQRETTVLWDKKTGKPIYNAIVWQSRQSLEICDDLIARGLEEEFHQKTGLLVNPYFSGSKIKWILDHVDNAMTKAKNGELLFGTIDTYLLWKLTKHQVHATDYSNASRTMIFNINTLKWDDQLLEYLDIPKCILPEVLPSSYIYGYANDLDFIDPLFNHIPIASLIGDQQASLFGQCCFDKGDCKSTYGTGCFILMNTKNEIIKSNKGLLTTIAWGLNNQIEYAFEGSVFISGSVIQWLRDNLEFFAESKDCENALKKPFPSNGVYFVPAFVGLGTPYWDNHARGAIFGLTRSTTKDNITAAAIEASAYQAKAVMDVMIEESNQNIHYLGVDGGASINNYMMQFQANLIDAKLIRPKCLETTALGACYLAGLATGVFKSLEEIKKLHQVEHVFIKNIDEKTLNKLLKGWNEAIKATLTYKNIS